jgi:hypothetical protein
MLRSYMNGLYPTSVSSPWGLVRLGCRLTACSGHLDEVLVADWIFDTGQPDMVYLHERSY